MNLIILFNDFSTFSPISPIVALTDLLQRSLFLSTSAILLFVILSLSTPAISIPAKLAKLLPAFLSLSTFTGPTLLPALLLVFLLFS